MVSFVFNCYYIFYFTICMYVLNDFLNPCDLIFLLSNPNKV